MNSLSRLVTVFGVAVVLSALFQVETQAEGGMTTGAWLIRPYLDLRVAYDNNVYQTERGTTDDFYAEPEVGLLFSSGPAHNALTLRGGLFYNRREYESESSRSHNSYGQNLELIYGDVERTRLQLVQGYRVVEDTDRHADYVRIEGLHRSLLQDLDAINVERGILDVGAAVDHRLTDRTQIGLAYLYTSLDYDENRFIDIDGHAAQGEIAYLATDKTAAFLTAGYNRQDQDGDNQTSDAYTGRLGVRTTETDKLSLRASVGAERYERSLADGDERSDDNFSFSASARWAATDKLTLQAGGFNGTQLSSLYRDNAMDYISAWLGLTLRATDNVTLLFNGAYRLDDYRDRIDVDGESVSRKDSRLWGSARINYQPPMKFMQLYAQVTVQDVDSNVAGLDYTRFRAILGTSIAY